MAKSKEKLAKEIMAEARNDGEPVTWEEALEMAEMEIKAAENGRRYEGDTTTRKKGERKVKIDEEKVAVIAYLSEQMKKYAGAEKVVISNQQREIDFHIGDSEYTLSLVKHRPPK